MRQVIAKLERGDVVTHPVTIVEGLTLDETAAALAASGLGDESRFRAAMTDPAPIRDLDPKAKDLEGYLFPSTYAFAKGTDEGAIVATLVRTFRDTFDRRPPHRCWPAAPCATWSPSPAWSRRRRKLRRNGR